MQLKVEKEFNDTLGCTKGEDIVLYITDADLRKYGERKGLDTPVVHTVNDEY